MKNSRKIKKKGGVLLFANWIGIELESYIQIYITEKDANKQKKIIVWHNYRISWKHVVYKISFSFSNIYLVNAIK